MIRVMRSTTLVSSFIVTPSSRSSSVSACAGRPSSTWDWARNVRKEHTEFMEPGPLRQIDPFFEQPQTPFQIGGHVDVHELGQGIALSPDSTSSPRLKPGVCTARKHRSGKRCARGGSRSRSHRLRAPPPPGPAGPGAPRDPIPSLPPDGTGRRRRRGLLPCTRGEFPAQQIEMGRRDRGEGSSPRSSAGPREVRSGRAGPRHGPSASDNTRSASATHPAASSAPSRAVSSSNTCMSTCAEATSNR